jgi:DNA-3-methyladenine glycosylase II
MNFTSEERELSQIDPDIGVIIQRNGPLVHAPRDDYFAALAGSIISQQISVKAAAKIFERFKDATELDSKRVANLQDEQIKMIGLSGQKSKYLHDLAEHFVRDSAVFNHLDTLSDDEVIIELTKIKGIGVWTAQMFLMFALVRLDVFAPDDRGIQLAIQKLYDLPTVPSRSELEKIAEKWQPYRTGACWHLWHSLDNEPVTD